MKARGDERIDAAIQQAVKAAPLDVLRIRDRVRRTAEDLLAGREGLLHSAILRGVRQGVLRVDGTSDHGLAQYGLVASSGQAALPAEVRKVDPVDLDVRAANKITAGIHIESTRERVTADMAAHRRALRDANAIRGFGPIRQVRQALRRVDRGRRTVLFTDGLGDMAKKVFVHEGPWILGAVIAFLLIRTFLAEVFVIPSASMVPSLLIGDRVVVLKPGGDARPERWQIVTFKREGVTYVKRAVALGGEKIAILGGDVYIDGSLATKPADLRDALRRPYAEWRLASPEAADAWGREEDPEGRETWVYDGPAFWSSRRPDGTPRAMGDVPLRDVYAALDVVRSPGGGVALDLLYHPVGRDGLPHGDVEGRLSIQVSDAGVRLEVNDGVETLWVGHDAAKLWGPLTLKISYVDGKLAASVGKVSWERELSDDEHPPRGAIVNLGLRRWGNRVGLERMRLDADLHYTAWGQLAVAPSPAEGADLSYAYSVPPGRVFFLGDNTTNSKDCRSSDVGPIPESDLIGPLRFRIWPPSRIGHVH